MKVVIPHEKFSNLSWWAKASYQKIDDNNYEFRPFVPYMADDGRIILQPSDFDAGKMVQTGNLFEMAGVDTKDEDWIILLDDDIWFVDIVYQSYNAGNDTFEERVYVVKTPDGFEKFIKSSKHEYAYFWKGSFFLDPMRFKTDGDQCQTRNMEIKVKMDVNIKTGNFQITIKPEHAPFAHYLKRVDLTFDILKAGNCKSENVLKDNLFIDVNKTTYVVNRC